VRLLFLEPPLSPTALTIPALLLAALVVPPSERCIVLIALVEATAPTATSSYSGAREEATAPIVGVILKAGMEAAATTAPSSFKVQEICTYIFTTRWIVDCGGVYLSD
jgi:hypothetical protein